MWLMPLPWPACGTSPVSPVDSVAPAVAAYTYRLCLSLPAFTKTASIPNVELQLKLAEENDETVIDPNPGTLIVSLPGGSLLTSSQGWPPPKTPSKSSQVGLPSLIGIGVTDAANTDEVLGPTSAAVVIPATRSHDSRR